jgi:phosphoribosylamine-glycine ligase
MPIQKEKSAEIFMDRGERNLVSEGGQSSTSGLPIRVGERLAVAVVTGEVTEEEDRNFVAAIEERHREGTFFRSTIGYTVAGTKR